MLLNTLKCVQILVPWIWGGARGFCISNEFPDDVPAAGLWAALEAVKLFQTMAPGVGTDPPCKAMNP